MATGNIGVDEGSTKFIATNPITEDAITKQVGRSVLNNSSGTEIGTTANPVTISGTISGTVNAIPQGTTTISGTVGGVIQVGNQPNVAVKTQLATGASDNQIKDATQFGDGVTSGLAGVHPELYNGTSYDRWKGDATNGAFVQVKNTVTVSGTTPPVQQVFQANLAQENGGKLESIANKIPSQGQATMSASQPVVVASDQTPYPTHATVTTYSGTQLLQHFRAFANVSAAQTDSNIVSAISGKIIRVTSFIAQAGSTATNLTFNSKGGGAGTAISMTFQNAINAGEVANHNPQGWFQTNVGEGLTVTTGAGSTTGVQVSYVVI